MNYKVCYRCGKESAFFLYPRSSFDSTALFYEDVSYWDAEEIITPKSFLFVCKKCVSVEMLIARLKGVKIILLDRIGPGYAKSHLSPNEWIKQKVCK